MLVLHHCDIKWCAAICWLLQGPFAALQVSISGQGLVFVVRTVKYSIFQRAGLYTYIAFFCAQVCSIHGLLASLG